MPPRRSGFEAYAHYQDYLYQATMWPSSDGEVRIDEMFPRHARSAYDKLLRWANTFSAGVALNINNSDERVAFVSNTVLARALLARSETNLLQPVPDPPAVVPDLTIATELAKVLSDTTAPMTLTEILDLAEKLTRKITSNWTVTEHSS